MCVVSVVLLTPKGLFRMSLTSDLKNTEWGKKERKKVREGGSEREERENERERERERTERRKFNLPV